MNDERLDALLAVPLPALGDDGFSARVAARIAHEPYRVSWLEVGVLAVTALVVAYFLPAGTVTELAVRLSAQIADSIGVAMVCLAIALSLFFLRYSTDA
jgi:hypothetical protein